MARALRLQCPGGRYHVTARGNNRGEIFWNDEDRFRFLELLSQLGGRFGTQVHGYVLMDNHYRLLLETPEPNLSRAMQWCPPLSWIKHEALSWLCGGNTQEERRAALRQYTEGPVRQGVLEAPWQRLVGGVVLGTTRFAEKLRQQVRGNPREQPALRAAPRAASWEQIVAALEQLKGESWNEFAERHGDWGRDAALWLGRCAGRLPLAQLGRLVGNLDYAVVSKAIARFEQRMRTEPQLRDHMANAQLQLSK